MTTFSEPLFHGVLRGSIFSVFHPSRQTSKSPHQALNLFQKVQSLSRPICLNNRSLLLSCSTESWKSPLGSSSSNYKFDLHSNSISRPESLQQKLSEQKEKSIHQIIFKEFSRGTVAQSVERPSKGPGSRCNSTDWRGFESLD